MSIERHGGPELVDDFHRLYYNSEVWTETFWRGVRVLKCPFDLWIYQEILFEHRPDFIVETGTWDGGSAFFLASICDLIDHGRVITIDLEARQDRPKHRRIHYMDGQSSTAESVLNQVRRRIGRGRTMVILDSDHQRDHVLSELHAYAPLVTPGQYLVVEDSNINGHPIRSDWGPGPAEALNEFLASNDDFEVDRAREKLKLTFNPGGYLRRRA